MYIKVNSLPSENPSVPNQSPMRSPRRKFGKKLYAIAAIIVVALVAVALFIPSGLGNSIPLSVNYQVGEKLTYETTETITSTQSQPAASGSINSTSTLEVIDFDGETYTVNRTITSMLHSKPFSISILENISKTGYVKYFFPGGTQHLVSNVSSNPILTELLSKPDAKVGDTWQIPLNNYVPDTSNTRGTVTLTFRSIEEITVPAGTYKVFKIDISADDIVTNVNIPASTASLGLPDTTNMSFNGQLYLEYGTCRQIESSAQFTISYQTGNKTTNLSYSSEMMLVQHIKP